MLIINLVDRQEPLPLVGAGRDRLGNFLRRLRRIESHRSLGNNHAVLAKNELVGLNGQRDFLGVLLRRLWEQIQKNGW